MEEIQFSEAAECLKTIAHPHRLAMIHYLLSHQKASVGELAEVCSIQSHVASEHLSMMKDRGLLRFEREGRKVFYFIKEHALDGIMQCVKAKFTKKGS